MENNSQTVSGEVRSILVSGFQVNSSEEISLNKNNRLVRGEGLVVVNTNGQVVYEGIRAFCPIAKKKHLIRLSDGGWMLLILNGNTKRRLLKRVNLRFDNKVLMFDERGKIHEDQESPYYPDLSC